jgi:hypothetical protein
LAFDAHGSSRELVLGTPGARPLSVLRRMSAGHDDQALTASLGRSAYKKAPRPFLISGPAYPMMPSWNQVVGFLTDWEGLRRMAA